MQVKTLRAAFAVNVLLVLMNQHGTILLHVLHFLLQPADDFVPAIRERVVVAEDADERRVEELRQFDGDLEALEMRVESLAEFYLADGRTDADDAQAVVR